LEAGTGVGEDERKPYVAEADDGNDRVFLLYALDEVHWVNTK
jgi:hypothetical protein